MIIKLDIQKRSDAEVLQFVLYNARLKLTKENSCHKDMIALLEGNKDNTKAIDRLKHEELCIRLNNNDIRVISDVLDQLNELKWEE